jgi:hypothetical protein
MTTFDEMTDTALPMTPDEIKETGFEGDVDIEARRLRVKREAERRVRDAEEAGEWSIPESRFSLAEELDIEDPPIEWEVEGLHEVGTNVLLTAAFKTGKTTLALNLMKSKMDGTPFLGHFTVPAPTGRIAWWNFELTERQARRWLREMGVTRPEWGSVLHFRGHKMPIHSDHVRDSLVSWLKERSVTYLIVDPFGSAYDGKENDNDEVREWTRRLDEIKALAGVDSVVLVTHTGRGGQEKGFEHARGAAKLDDWNDIRWVYAKDRDDSENEARYFYAHGREVDFPETGVSYDEASRTLRIDASVKQRGSKEASKAAVMRVCEIVQATPRLNRTELVEQVGGRKTDAQKAVSAAIEQGHVLQEKGAKANEKLHVISPGFVWAREEKSSV